MDILVTGGAGYIGTVLVNMLTEQYNVTVADKLLEGKKLSEKVKYIKTNLEKQDIENIFNENYFDVIIHLAAFKQINGSKEKFDEDVEITKNLIETMKLHKTKKIIFSSSAAVYGDPKEIPITEDTECNPTNPYGISKLECENIIKQSGINYVIFRYFNVAGGEDEGAAAFAKLLQSLKTYTFTINGTDYETKDGTCIRDYIHVNDLVRAHIPALNLEVNEIINLGSGVGTSTKEAFYTFVNKVKKPIKLIEGPRREGDIVVSLSSITKALILLNWKPELDLNDIIDSILDNTQ